MVHIWSAFVDLSNRRDGLNPIKYEQMLAYQSIKGVTLSYFEVEVIEALDRSYVRIANG